MAKARIVIVKPKDEAFRALVTRCQEEFLVRASIMKEEPGHEVPDANYYPVIFSIEADDVREIFHLGMQWGKVVEKQERSQYGA